MLASLPTTGLGATSLSTAPTPPGPDALRLDLRSAVVRALQRNKALAVTKVNPDIAVGRVMVEQGAFDETATLDRQKQHTETPTGSQLEGASVSVRDTQFANFGLKKKWRDGTQSQLLFNNQRLQTNSSFQSLNPQFTSNLIAQLTRPVLRNGGWGANTANLRIAINGVRQNDLRLRKAMLDTVANVERAYWELVFARADRDVKRFSLAAANELLLFNQRRQQVGVGSEVEVLEARTSAAARQSELELSRRIVSDDEEILRHLATLDNVPPGIEIFPTDTLPGLPVPVALPRALQTAYEQRPDYRDLMIEVKNRKISLAFLKNQKLPRIDLVASYGKNGLAGTHDAAFDQVTGSDFPQYTLGFQVEVPLENRVARGNYRVGQLQARQALMNVKATQDQIEEEVSRSVRSLETDLQRVDVARMAQDLAAQQLRAAESRFREGLLANIDLLRFQQDLANARSTAIRALVDVIKDGITLEQTTGVLLDTRKIIVDHYPIPHELKQPPEFPLVSDESSGD